MSRFRPSPKAVAYLLLIAACVLFALPLWWALVTSVRSPATGLFRDVYPFSLKAFVPYEFTPESYIALFTEHNFGRTLFNSVFVAGATVVLGVLVNSAAGFAFARFDFVGKRLLFVLVLLSFMIPFEAILIPLYQLVDALGWINSYAALIIPGVPSGLIIFMFRQFFLGIPRELYDAAVVDGAGPLRVLWSVYLPLTRPAVITASLLIFLGQWQSFLWPLVTVRSPDLWTAQLTLASFQTVRQTDWGVLLAGVVITSIIPILLLIPLQRYLQLSFVQGGVRG